MIYVTEIAEKEEGLIYYMFDTYTDSTIIDKNGVILKEFLQRGYKVTNARIVSEEIIVTHWNCKLRRDIENRNRIPQIIALGKIDENMYKIATIFGYVRCVPKEKINSYVEANDIANCIKTETGYRLLDTIDYTVDTEFKDRIEKKYLGHLAKTSLMGNDMTFEYRIEEDRVILTKYTGKSKNPILPNFITDISTYAFKYTQITSIKLNDGLRRIGEWAMVWCNLSEITIPETVEIIGPNTFRHNKLMYIKKELNTNKIKLLNKDTLLLDKGI